MNDEELIQQFYKSDQEALNVLFTRHKEGLFNFALRLAGNRADAEDAVSQAFVAVCERKYQPRPQASFKTWLYTVARNACLSKFRIQNKIMSLWFKKDADQAASIDVMDSSPIAHEQLSQKETMVIIQQAIAKLPVEQKEALLLREYHGFSYEEIAQVLDCSMNKVKILIFRARGMLKDMLPPLLLGEDQP